MSPSPSSSSADTSDDLETDEVLKGFDFLANSEDMEGLTEAPPAGERGDWGETHSFSHSALIFHLK